MAQLVTSSGSKSNPTDLTRSLLANPHTRLDVRADTLAREAISEGMPVLLVRIPQDAKEYEAKFILANTLFEKDPCRANEIFEEILKKAYAAKQESPLIFARCLLGIASIRHTESEKKFDLVWEAKLCIDIIFALIDRWTESDKLSGIEPLISCLQKLQELLPDYFVSAHSQIEERLNECDKR